MIGRAIRRYSCKVLVFWLRDNIVCIIGFDMAIFKKKKICHGGWLQILLFPVASAVVLWLSSSLC